MYIMNYYSYIAQFSYTKDIIVRRRRINAYRIVASRRIFVFYKEDMKTLSQKKGVLKTS